MSGKRYLALMAVLLLCLALAGSVASAGAGHAHDAAYRLTTGAWVAEGAASGPGYQLLGAERHQGAGTPCCCVYAPCIRR